jgi:hypothetical protein
MVGVMKQWKTWFVSLAAMHNDVSRERRRAALSVIRWEQG